MTPTPRPLKDRYDVVVIGGGAAGLSAAVTLGRALRSVVVVDDGRPRNAPAEGVHGFLTREGMSPHALLDVGRAEARSFGATLLDASAVTTTRSSEGFTVGLADGGSVIGRRLLVATGLTDGLPPIPGLREQWGAGVVHCPYCHGYEIRGRRIGVLGTGPLSVHQALLFRQWSDDITLFLNDTVVPSDEDWDRLAARSIRVVDGRVVSVDEADGVLTGVTLQGGRHIDLQALAVGTRMEARSALLEPLGLTAREHPSGMGHVLDGGPMGSTQVPGLYVAGNVADLAAQVIVAAAEGTMAGAAINADLVQEETAWAVEGVRGPFSAALEAEVSDRVLGLRRHGVADGPAEDPAGGPAGEVHHGVHDGVAGGAAPAGTRTGEGVRRAG